MLRFSEKPKKPENFDSAVKDAKGAIQAIVEGGINDRGAFVPGRMPVSDDFKNRWRAFKAHLLRAQHDRCGYCELPLPSHPGDVEHYRPKALVQVLPLDNPGLWGKEGDGDYGVIGRRPMPLSDEGYWWEAYTWENYVAACNRCNSGWKRNLFPIDEDPPTGPRQGKGELALLLNPFYGDHPDDHLEYDSVGQIMPRNGSKLGLATIVTCGLDRNSLVRARAPQMRTINELLNDYADAETVRERKRALKHLVLLGSEDSYFPGMVRAVVRQKLQLPWDACEKLLD